MDSEQEDYEEIAEEDEVIAETPRQPKKILNKPIVNTQERTPKRKEVPIEKAPESRYVAYRVNAQEGIMDTETNTPVGNEVYVILAEILNKLNNIEISQG